jgi:hypothetical protein
MHSWGWPIGPGPTIRNHLQPFGDDRSYSPLCASSRCYSPIYAICVYLIANLPLRLAISNQNEFPTRIPNISRAFQFEMVASVLMSWVSGPQNKLFDAGGVDPAKLNIRSDPFAIWSDSFAQIHVIVGGGGSRIILYIYIYSRWADAGGHVKMDVAMCFSGLG